MYLNNHFESIYNWWEMHKSVFPLKFVFMKEILILRDSVKDYESLWKDDSPRRKANLCNSAIRENIFL